MMTKDEFIFEAQFLVAQILSMYNSSLEDIQTNELPDCFTCNGGMYIEQNGDIIDCPTCKGTGEGKFENDLNTERFARKVENLIWENELFWKILEYNNNE